MDAIIIFVTCANKEEAAKISQALVKDGLAACVNIIAGIESVFWWEEKVQSAEEVLLIAKSQKSKLKEIIILVKSMHSYQIPEIIAVPIIGGYQPYLDWINDSIRKPH